MAGSLVSAGGPPSQDRDMPAVLLCDSRTIRISTLVELFSKLRASVLLHSPESEPPFALKGSGVGLVALEGEAEFERRIRLLTLLKNAGFALLAYEDGVEWWPLERRCRPLLAGAAKVLDSKADSFASEVAAWVERTLDKLSARSSEDTSAKVMLDGLGIVGDSAAMVLIFRAVLRISALSDLPVLLTGETGTGKELLAGAIHKLDPKRSRGPLIAINCGAIPNELMESELFGSRKGAFTGAVRDRPGLVRSADGGVLFLDEIGDLDERAQGKLLRVLQEKRVLGVGDDRETAVDIRLVAATNRDLAAMVQKGTFRADLFHRLCVLPIHVPPLRERPQDLAPLAWHLLKKHRALARRPVEAIGQDFFDALLASQLPGNVRQLENVLQWVLVNRDEAGPLTMADLPPEIWQQASTMVRRGAPDPDEGSSSRISETSFFQEMLERHDSSLVRSLAYCERRLVEVALQIENGNQTHAARLLGVTPRSIYNKVRKHALRATPPPSAKAV